MDGKLNSDIKGSRQERVDMFIKSECSGFMGMAQTKLHVGNEGNIE